MIIAVDAMGGDNAPGAIVSGAVSTVQRDDRLQIILVGDRERVAAELKKHQAPADRISIVHAPDVIEMVDSPVWALRRKRKASILVAANLVKKGRAQALVSAGNTGAVVAAAMIRLGKIWHVRKPGIALTFPTARGVCTAIDMGASVNPKPKDLLNFALMGSLYHQAITGQEKPRVGILNIGTEHSKGYELLKKTHVLLQEAPVNFVGNVESGDILNGQCDVAVMEGFLGNVFLKLMEALAENFGRMLIGEAQGVGPEATAAMKAVLAAYRKKTDYDEYGGAPLLGTKGVAIIAHGRSSPKAIEAAIGVARKLAAEKIVERIAEMV